MSVGGRPDGSGRRICKTLRSPTNPGGVNGCYSLDTRIGSRQRPTGVSRRTGLSAAQAVAVEINKAHKRSKTKYIHNWSRIVRVSIKPLPHPSHPVHRGLNVGTAGIRISGLCRGVRQGTADTAASAVVWALDFQARVYSFQIPNLTTPLPARIIKEGYEGYNERQIRQSHLAM